MYRNDDSDNFKLSDYNILNGGNRFKVLGKGTVMVKPDIVEITIGVITESVQLEVAQEENSIATQQVINSIKRVGILPKYIQTQNYNIRPNYDYADGKQIFRGYEVSNYLKVIIRNVNTAGEVIDTAVRNGANTISGISFIVSDQSRHYYEALRLALEDAQNKASIMANKLKVKLNNVPIHVAEQEKGTITPLTVMTLKSSGGDTPIEAGENKITADIEAVFVYTQ